MSLKKIAQELGLSLTTVSRALNGYPEVAKATQLAVQAEAERQGYKPNVTARNLALGRANAVGLVFPITPGDLGDSYFLQVAAAISERLAQADIDLLIISAYPDQELLSYQRTITARRTDAFIVARTRVHDERLQLLAASGTPFVAYGRSQLDQPYAWFDFDNQAGGALAAERLISLGHTRLAYLGAPPDYNFAAQRFAGFMQRCEQAGLSPRPEHILRGSLDRRSGYAAMQQLLALDSAPTALLVDNHLAGTGALHALQNAGLQVGRDLSIVVYDGLSADSVIRAEVTSVLQVDETLVGKTLAELVLARLDGIAPDHLQTLWQPTLKIGASDGPPVPS